jgi:hypothetical protein
MSDVTEVHVVQTDFSENCGPHELHEVHLKVTTIECLEEGFVTMVGPRGPWGWGSGERI